MDLNPLVRYLENQGVGVVGKDLFSFSMPDSVTRGVVLMAPLSGVKVDNELGRCYFEGKFQAIIRDPSYQDGYERAEEVRNALTKDYLVVEGQTFKKIHPKHLPVPFKRSDGNQIEFSINFDIVFVVQ